MVDGLIDPQILKSLCAIYGFARKGKAVFRAYGDGVLQVIKYEKLRHFPVHEINVGLFSLYGELRAEWFTSRGCIPRYPIVIFEGKRSALYLENVGGIYYQRVITAEQQLDILEQKVIPFLNEIKSQAQLAEAICELDRMMYSNVVLWNDILKFEPYLYSGDNRSAEKVIRSILDQHHSALEKNRIDMSPEGFQAYAVRIQEEDHALEMKLGMARLGNKHDIQNYLAKNYAQNCKQAKFAFPK